MTTIYVNLIDEAVDVMRPIQAEHTEGHVYVIVDQPYNPEIERWEFEPGVRVLCESVDTNAGPVLLAVRSIT